MNRSIEELLQTAEDLIIEIHNSLREYESVKGKVYYTDNADSPPPIVVMSDTIPLKIELAKMYLTLARTKGGL